MNRAIQKAHQGQIIGRASRLMATRQRHRARKMTTTSCHPLATRQERFHLRCQHATGQSTTTPAGPSPHGHRRIETSSGERDRRGRGRLAEADPRAAANEPVGPGCAIRNGEQNEHKSAGRLTRPEPRPPEAAGPEPRKVGRASCLIVHGQTAVVASSSASVTSLHQDRPAHQAHPPMMRPTRQGRRPGAHHETLPVKAESRRIVKYWSVQ